ncbi:hypothetical protein HMN09_01362800 [Mycena chlorophos]|uniref:Uncharacterized protein n=1 Tax=Mycena chlorophos TaxID=658473 RepID=A0A8H6RYA3_MYCCL|nr:hypothetical protein HMN09_01362800 [Mycena chlorophos]
MAATLSPTPQINLDLNHSVDGKHRPNLLGGFGGKGGTGAIAGPGGPGQGTRLNRTDTDYFQNILGGVGGEGGDNPNGQAGTGGMGEATQMQHRLATLASEADEDAMYAKSDDFPTLAEFCDKNLVL